MRFFNLLTIVFPIKSSPTWLDKITLSPKVLKAFDIEKIYNTYEGKRHVISFTREFPFVKISKRPYVCFRYKTVYNVATSPWDAIYKVDCNLIEFCKLLDISFSSFAEAKMRTAIDEG